MNSTAFSGLFSLVMPVYNEEAIIETVVAGFQTALGSLPQRELILVNDASTDRTGILLDRLAAQDATLKVIHLPRNSGHGAALLAGYAAARGEAVFHCDSDNQHDPNEVGTLLPLLESNDVVIGVRRHRSDPFYRRAISGINRTLCRMLFGSRLSDHNSPFKLHRRAALDKILAIVAPRKPFAPSIEMALTAHALGLRIAEVPIRHFPRKTGTISILRWRLLNACWRVFGELRTLRLRLRSVS